LLVAVYLLALSAFLGLDILGKVPPTLYPAVLAGLGGLASVGAVGALKIEGTPAVICAALGGLAAGAGLVAVGRLMRAAGNRA